MALANRMSAHCHRTCDPGAIGRIYVQRTCASWRTRDPVLLADRRASLSCVDDAHNLTELRWRPGSLRIPDPRTFRLARSTTMRTLTVAIESIAQDQTLAPAAFA